MPAASLRASILSTWVAGDPASMLLLQQTVKIAASASAVLIRGECGVGKKLLAQLLHFLGPNADEALVRVDCASLPSELLKSELFGQADGTGAAGEPPWKRGALELAGSGTLVLDEIAALSAPLQAKLLRVMDEKQFSTGRRVVATNARILALTRVDLEWAVARRTFREDLYFRLAAIPITVPPLRERIGDIRPLAERFLQQLAKIHCKPRMTFSNAAMAVLEAYSYPGNVRELRNVVERAVQCATTAEIRLEDLPTHLLHPLADKPVSLEELERGHIAEVLDFTGGKKTQAARILGISRKTLLEKRKRYGLG